ncbi:hypothetical protein, variant 1 [Aphanomyces invadans]|uniref:USP domain-containing protein n=1 Tax=Aphanomyces invadans TaxID=157072 RepID=A0A024UCC4_9STRA|nr:hypothetical protein, variant 1 [Aphanomyces invadans]ETW03889.1 hypothetical protein, variant 1 [Aphanomyces invadans]|eukprot:XP_008866845.1 hypothetical protein, variant 1 [Aphanomyces invadans]
MAQGRVILFGDFTAEETQEVLATSHIAPPPQQPKLAKPFSWSNLAKSQTASGPSRPPPTVSVNTLTTTLETAFEEALTELNLHECARDLQRRGFVNQGNTCFQNVTFQALLACPPFRNLLCLLSAKAGDINVTRQPLVGWKHLIQLIRELDEPTLAQQMTMKQQHKKPAAPVILSPHFLRLFQSANGMQQDALEFLEFLLDHLHVDFETSPCSFPLHAPASPHDGWAEIQKHGKASIVHHNIVENHSPITFLFKGTLRSELIRAGRKVGAATIEPFHCLHLTTPSLTATLSQMIQATMADEVRPFGPTPLRTRTSRSSSHPPSSARRSRRFPSSSRSMSSGSRTTRSKGHSNSTRSFSTPSSSICRRRCFHQRCCTRQSAPRTSCFR